MSVFRNKGKPIILTFIRHYLPGYKYGGPVRTVANIVDHLGDDFDFRIVTSDRDALDELPYPNVAIDNWNRVGKAKVYYLSLARCSLRTFTKLIADTPHDVLYLNSFFDPVFTVQPLLGRRFEWLSRKPVIIAPRGEFSPGAIGLKRRKKLLFFMVARLCRLYKGVIWHASSLNEVADIQHTNGLAAQKIVVAPNLSPTKGSQAPQHSVRACGGSLRIVFLSRITPKKNLDFALAVLAQLSVPAVFNIYGPVANTAYWDACRARINALPSHIQVAYRGEVRPEEVPYVFAQHDLFLFPTRGENFGHVILEALSAGTPVLISDHTPWQQDSDNACQVIPLTDTHAYVQAIELRASCDNTQLQTLRQAAKDYAVRFLHDKGILDANRRLFMEAVTNTGTREFTHA